MNSKQKKILCCGIGAILVMAVFPPVFGSYEIVSPPNRLCHPSFMAYGIDLCSNNFYGFLLRVPASNIAFGTLLGQCLVVAAITSGLLYVFRNKEGKSYPSERFDGVVTNDQIHKPKVSKLAVASLVVPCLVVVNFLLCIVLQNISWGGRWEDLINRLTHFTFFVTFALPLGLTLGILALDQIRESKGQLAGRKQAIMGTAVGVVLSALVVVLIILVPDLGPN